MKIHKMHIITANLVFKTIFLRTYRKMEIYFIYELHNFYEIHIHIYFCISCIYCYKISISLIFSVSWVKELLYIENKIPQWHSKSNSHQIVVVKQRPAGVGLTG